MCSLEKNINSRWSLYFMGLLKGPRMGRRLSASLVYAAIYMAY